MMWRHKHSIFQTDPDPVLTGTKLSGLFLLTTYTRQQYFMRLSQQSVRQGQLVQSLNRKIDRMDVVLHLSPVVAFFGVQIIGILECIFDIGLRTFDPAGLRRLFRHIHTNEELNIGD